MDRSTGRTLPGDDTPSSGETDPRQATMLAESRAISPYLLTWLLTGNPGEFTVIREGSGMLSVAVDLPGAAEPPVIPWPTPPGHEA